MINGREFGPEDGLVVETESFEIEPGGEPVGSVWNDSSGSQVSPLATWGSSYAISQEVAWITYNARAKAAANVYAGERIIRVCFWYSREGEMRTETRCSNAYSNGAYWTAGPEVTGGATDTLDPNAPPTIFNISTTRIDPGIV